MSDALTKHLMFATDVWDYSMKNARKVTPTATFLRGSASPLTMAVMDRHDAGDLDLLRSGVVPIVPPSPETSARLLKPLIAKMGVEGVIFVALGTRVGEGLQDQRVLMLWSIHLPTNSEVTWCRYVAQDGTVSPPVDVDETVVVGVDWIKAAL